MRQNNNKVDVDTNISTPMITAAREGVTDFSRTTSEISLFHAMLFWRAPYGLIDVLIIW
jgi:hypothetical protein